MTDHPEDSAPSTHFSLAGWLVEPPLNRISREGVERKVESKVMAVLAYFASRPGELVSREELEQHIWQGRVVGYDALTNAITKLRKALDDDPRKPRYIETVPKKGYRLIAPVTAVSRDRPTPRNPAVSRRPGTTWLLLSLLAVAVALPLLLFLGSDEPSDRPEMSETPTIVVLPFLNLGQVPAQDYLSEGMTTDITTALSKLSGFTVISPFTARNFDSSRGEVTRVARQLAVRYVLVGNVRHAGDRLRINARLIDGQNGAHLWAQNYDRQIQDIFQVQDDITARIVDALAVNLTEEEKRRTARRYTTSIEAYERFLQGQRYLAHYTRADNLRARDLFEHAVDLDPAFARAYGALAMTYTLEFRFQWADMPEAVLDQAFHFAQKAIALDPDLPQAYWVLGYVHLFRQQYAQSINTTAKAIALNPNSADAYVTLAIAHAFNGEPERSIRLIRKAMRLNPQYPAIYPAALGQAHYLNGDDPQAIDALREAIEKNVNFLPPHVYLVASLIRSGQQEEARWEAELLHSLAPAFVLDDIPTMFPLRDRQRLVELTKRLQQAGLQGRAE